MLIITDTSIKNKVATLISHIYRDQEIIAKSVYYTTNVNFTEAEIFAIKYGINHTTHLKDINYIIAITDTISAAYYKLHLACIPTTSGLIFTN